MQSSGSALNHAVDASPWIGATVVAPDGAVEGEINEAVFEAATGQVKYFIVATVDTQRGGATIFALPYSDCTFDAERRSCVAKSLYPLRM